LPVVIFLVTLFEIHSQVSCQDLWPFKLTSVDLKIDSVLHTCANCDPVFSQPVH
jgi:hypothetical protein